MSGLRVVFRNTKRTWFFDAFPSIDKVSKVKSPVLVIHGTDDEVIDFSHGIGIYERCPKAVEPLWVEGAGHNDNQLDICPSNSATVQSSVEIAVASSLVNKNNIEEPISNTPSALTGPGNKLKEEIEVSTSSSVSTKASAEKFL
ncbi:unnamed protein product [Ceratitis capitata]|uniref:(Mediterranean fruit fly) hypothetical protein n=1 Tax=Ceratitis capitata TaxID=7213 RepID=A0A811U8S9_CERCA|nr:unnamed protein product [Ceratitis capitata]